MAVQNVLPDPRDRVLIIVEGSDDKKILTAIFRKIQMEPKARIIQSGGISNIPQTIKQEYRNHDRILVIVDSDRDPPEKRAKDLYHKIWEALNQEGFSEESTQNYFYRLKSRDGSILDIIIYPLFPEDYDQIPCNDRLSSECSERLNALVRSWPSELLSLVFPALLNQSVLIKFCEIPALSNQSTLIYNKFCEIIDLLIRQNFPIPTVKFAIRLIGNLAGNYGSNGDIAAKIIENMDDGLFQKQFGRLIGLVQHMLKSKP